MGASYSPIDDRFFTVYLAEIDRLLTISLPFVDRW